MNPEIADFFTKSVEYSNGFLYFFSSLAQCAAGFAALVAVFAVFRFQANNDIVRKLYEEINDWLVIKQRSSYSDHDQQGAIYKKIKAFSEQKDDAKEARVLFDRLKAVEEFPKTLANNASKPLRHWVYVCFFSLLVLVIIELSYFRTRGLQYFFSAILIITTINVFFETKNFIQSCLRS